MPIFKKFLFQDFDGVLNNDYTTVRFDPQSVGVVHIRHHQGLERDKVNLVNVILDACPDVGLVFSTHWRATYKDEQLLKILDSYGFRHGDRYVGRTPLYWTINRNREITDWLDAREDQIERFLILDDMPTQFKANHIMTDPFEGLTPDHVKTAIEILRDGPGHTKVDPSDEVWKTVEELDDNF